MNRLLAILPLLFSYSLAFAETGEVPMETAGIGGVIAFFVVCIALTAAFFWFMRKGSKRETGDKIGESK